MEAYPEDLLVGVSPLVLAVNAIFQSNAEQDVVESDAGISVKHRSLFDRFLDAMAASLGDENDSDDEIVQELRPPSRVSIFRPDEDETEDSSDDDVLFVDENEEGNDVKKNSFSLTAPPFANMSFRLRSSAYHGSGIIGGNGSGGFENHSKRSYAKALKHGQGFFQRARIVSISAKHGFPPSKDPEGKQNLAHAIPKAKSSLPKLRLLFKSKPLQGIIPSGWLQKHVHALPSALLVVVELSEENQERQNAFLLNTLEHLHESLVPKRDCQIHIICLVADNISSAQAEQWNLNMNRQILEENKPNVKRQEPRQITLLRVSRDLHSNSDGFPTSGALRKLYRLVRESSFTYYLRQARWTKQKLLKLLAGRRKSKKRYYPKEILPLCIRYCFKIAIFYEFLWKHEKSLKFLAEAYRHVRNYYRFLQRIKNVDEEEDEIHSKLKKLSTTLTSNISFSTARTSDAEEGMEVSVDQSIASSNDDNLWLKAVPSPPDDMVYQCRAVADWLNFKLLQAGFVSSTEGGILAASEQWRRHCQVFLTRTFFFASEDWYYWCQVAHERLVMSQLIERNPPNALGELGNAYDEVLFRCSPWRAYQSVTEALLKAGVGVQRILAKKEDGWKETLENGDEMRAPFVGGLDNHGLGPMLDEQSQINHREKALEFVLRAVSLYEQELEKQELQDANLNIFYPLANKRSGARLYYLAGGILLGANRCKEAATFLKKAEMYCEGWSGLQLAVRRLLIQCYVEKCIPSITSQPEINQVNQVTSSTILETLFNSLLSPEELRNVLNIISSKSDSERLKWYGTYTDEPGSSLPFTFLVSFPGRTHATSGDTVTATIVIKSNLCYAVHIDSVTMLSLAGAVDIPPNDLLNARNAISGADGGIILEAKGEILVTTLVNLPKDFNDVVIEESGMNGEKKNISGKGSFLKSARPRAAGVTSAAGGRFLSEDITTKSKSSKAQCSRSFLGGKSLRCNGMCFLFRPILQSKTDTVDDKKINAIEVMIEKKKPKILFEKKRTPFEEDNYLCAAWSRPPDLPLLRGPRCLRTVGPTSDMIITNLTLPITENTALEGTVNRILLKLEAGPSEICKDLKYQIKFSSVFVAADGKTLNLSEESSSPEQGIPLKEKNAKTRAPLIVARDPDSSLTESKVTEYGYAIPEGWIQIGSDSNKSDFMVPKVSTVKNGESTFAFFDLFRPSPLSRRRIEFLSEIDYDNDEHGVCQTDFEVKISYLQERFPSQKEHFVTKGVDNFDSSSVIDSGKYNNSADLVTIDYSSSVTWCAPLSAAFSKGVNSSYPSGSRYPLNSNSQTVNDDNEIRIVNGERNTTRCALQGNKHLRIEIARIQFEDNTDPQSLCNVALVSGVKSSSADRVVYEARGNDPCRFLSDVSKFSFAYTAESKLKSSCIESDKFFSFPLGFVKIEWMPELLKVDEDVRILHGIDHHGPLILDTPLTLYFRGPTANIMNAPFEVNFQCIPSTPNVAVPFQVVYVIKNKTKISQNLFALLDEHSGTTSEDILVCGLVKGDISLAPSETQAFSYTALATRSGRTSLPSLSISSTRYNTRVVDEVAQSDTRSLFVLP